MQRTSEFGQPAATWPSGLSSPTSALPVPSATGPLVRLGRKPRIAIAHDYLTQMGGAERVVLSLARAFPEAPIYTTLYDPDATFPEFRDLDVRVSSLNRIGALRRNHRAALPFLPFASRSIHIDADIVVASSSGWAHGFSTDAKRLVYCHTPARWLYLTDDYLGLHSSRTTRGAIRLLGPALRRWDKRAAKGATRYVANSSVVRDRVREQYGVEAAVLAPPYRVAVDGEQERPCVLDELGWSDFHLVVSRLLPYKHVEETLNAFRLLPDERLVVVGAGPLEERLRAMAPDNVVLMGHIPDAELRWLYAHAHAMVAASYEDFGLSIIEAAAFGTPALALRAGGYLETVLGDRTGLFFEEPTPEAIAEAVRRHRARPISRFAVCRHADEFTEAKFVERIHAAVDQLQPSETRSSVIDVRPSASGADKPAGPSDEGRRSA